MDGRLYIVDVVDSVDDYVQLMRQIFDFDSIGTLLTGSDGNEPLRIRIDCLNGGGCPAAGGGSVSTGGRWGGGGLVALQAGAMAGYSAPCRAGGWQLQISMSGSCSLSVYLLITVTSL